MSSQTATTAISPREKYYFLARRLHSLTGLMFSGFVCFHLLINATVLTGGESFQFCVEKIHILEHMGILVPVEMATIFFPIAFHALFGIVILLTSQSNMKDYPYGGNIRYTLQRLSAVVILVFLTMHIWHMHWLGKPFGGAQFDPANATSTAAAAMQSWSLWAPIYAIGVAATVFHLANGIWTALITWGVTIGPRSQRVAGYCCVALGAVLFVAGLGAVRGFMTYSVADGNETAAVEQVEESGH
ncbi:MAG TPA: succinate dehydrogenase [Phycisphaerae bacterium]|nr:succinate dehydrogenase [Phycisphaerae bacterium]